MSDFSALLFAALLSSLITMVVLALVFHFYLGPKLERRLEDRFQRGAEQLEERLRKRLLDLLTGKSREVIRDTAFDVARGFGLIGGRRPRSEDDPLIPRDGDPNIPKE